MGVELSLFSLQLLFLSWRQRAGAHSIIVRISSCKLAWLKIQQCNAKHGRYNCWTSFGPALGRCLTGGLGRAEETSMAPAYSQAMPDQCPWDVLGFPGGEVFLVPD